MPPEITHALDEAIADRINGHREAPHDPEAFDALIREVEAAEADGGRPPLAQRMLSLDELRSVPPPTPIVAHLLDFDSLVLAYGKRASAKSFCAVDLTASIATGTRWHGRAVESVPVVYVVAESVGGVLQRYDAWFDENGLTRRPGRDRLVILPEPVNLLNGPSVDAFTEAAGELGARFIVFDTLARCMVGGDENSARDAGIAIAELDRIRRRTGACVVAVHHAGKDAANGARGSSAFEAAADTVIEIVNSEGHVTVTCTKQKNHATPNPIHLRLTTVGLSAVLSDRLPDVEGITRGMIETLAALADVEVPGGVASGVWRLSSGKPEPTFYRHRKDLLTLGLALNVGTDKQPRYSVSDAGTLTLSEDSHGSQ